VRKEWWVEQPFECAEIANRVRKLTIDVRVSQESEMKSTEVTEKEFKGKKPNMCCMRAKFPIDAGSDPEAPFISLFNKPMIFLHENQDS